MNWPLVILCVVAGAIAVSASVATYNLFRTPVTSETSEWVSELELGVFERDLPQLHDVIVLANRVEKPDKKFREAVIDNLKQGVKYSFVVPHANLSDHVEIYTEFFDAMMTIARSEQPGGPRGSYTFSSIDRPWDDYPYIFYVYNGGPEKRVLAFRGDQKREGIANYYRLLEPAFAESMANLLQEALRERAGLSTFANARFELGQEHEATAGSVTSLEQYIQKAAQR